MSAKIYHSVAERKAANAAKSRAYYKRNSEEVRRKRVEKYWREKKQ